MSLMDFPAAWGLSAHIADAPAADGDDFLALLPQWMRDGVTAPLTGMAEAVAEAFVRYASSLADLACESDAQYASESGLQLLGASRGMPRADGEDVAAYRTRLLQDADALTPAAILSAIDRILAPVTPRVAYYYERPADDVWVHSKADVGSPASGPWPGCFVHARGTRGTNPIRKQFRYRSERSSGRTAPRYVLLWAMRRTTWSEPVTPADSSIVANGQFGVSFSYGSTESTQPANSYGHCIVGLPGFLAPGRRKPSESFVHGKATAPLVDTVGNVLPDAAARAAVLSYVWSKAAVAARIGLGIRSGPYVYESAKTARAVNAQVTSLLASRGMFPVQFTILYDPSL